MIGDGAESYDPLECVEVARVAALLGVSKSQVYALARRGEIPHVRAGGSVLFPRGALERWLGGADRVVESDRPRARVDRLGAGRRSRGSARR